MSAADNYRGKEVREGPLAGHYRDGKVYRPPLKAMSVFQSMDWKSDDLPDMIWLLLVVSVVGDQGIEAFSKAQAQVLVDCPALADRHYDGGLDGRLTTLDAIAEAEQPAFKQAVRSLPVAASLLSQHVCSTMSMYGLELPGRWFFEGIHDEHLPHEECAEFLARALINVCGDDHKTAVAKYIPLLWRARTGGMTVPPDLAQELSRYPNEPSEVRKVDATVRVAWMSTKIGASEGLQDARSRWASTFWRTNWQMSYCMPESEKGTHDESDEPVGASQTSEDDAEVDGSAEPQEDPQSAAMQEVLQKYDRFLDVVFDPASDVDIQRPARLEVLAGLVARSYRFSMALLSAPQLWSGEQSAGTFRALFESRLYATWMLAQEDPDEWFTKYQEYGRGKQKLMKSLVDDLVKRTEETNEYLDAVAKHLEEKTGGDAGQMFQDVSLEGNFAGRSVRKMAFEVGLEDDYRMIYQTMSGITHGEWWAIEEYSMERCMNILHGFHLLPTMSAFHWQSDEVALGVVGSFTAMVDVAYEGLGIDASRRSDQSQE